MYLMVKLWNKSYFRTSNVLVNFILIENGTDNAVASIECGYQTTSAEGLWHLFISGHKVVTGTPKKFLVEITPQEARIFKMIAETGFWRKRSYWKPTVETEKSRASMRKELEERLPVWVLKSKLSVDKKC